MTLIKNSAFHHDYHSKGLHVIALLFLVVYVFAYQWMFSTSDQFLALDHDPAILQGSLLLVEYDQGPWNYINNVARSIFLHIQEMRYPTVGISSVLLSAMNMWVFGKSIMVYKMTMFFPLALLIVAVYAILFQTTRKELLGFIGGLLVLNTPNIIHHSRKFFAFLPLAVACAWAIYFAVRIVGRDRLIDYVMFCIFLFLGVSVHSSSYMYYPILVTCLLLCPGVNWKRMGGVVVCVGLMMLWNLQSFKAFMVSKVSHKSSSTTGLAHFMAFVKGFDWSGFHNQMTYEVSGWVFYLLLFQVAVYCIHRILKGRTAAGVEHSLTFIINTLIVFVVAVVGVMALSIERVDYKCFTMAFVAMVMLHVMLAHYFYKHMSDGFLPMKTYAVACLLILFYATVARARYFETCEEGPLFPHEFKVFVDARGCIYENDDTEALGSFLEHLKRARGGEGVLSIDTADVRLYRDRSGVIADDIFPLSLDFTDGHRYVNPTAFFRDVPVEWNYVFLRLNPEKIKRKYEDKTFAPHSWNISYDDVMMKYREQMVSPAPPGEYLFLFVYDSTVKSIRDRPDEALLRQKLRLANPAVYGKFLSGRELIHSYRIYSSIYVNVYGPTRKPRRRGA